MPAEFIYTAYKLARHYPPDRTVLEDISISFYPGAKIGVIGPNGSGKSSLLRIMAGLDDGFNGEARLTPGFTVGYLSQEPQLDAGKDVKGNVLDGVREVQGLIDQYNAVMARWSEPDADYEAIGAEQSSLEDRINAADAWNLERNVDIAMDALRCPPDDADVATLSGGEKRRVALCRLLLQHPDLLLLDEPLGALDRPLRRRILPYLVRLRQHFDVPLLLVSHDPTEIQAVCEHVFVLHQGSIIAQGAPAEVLAWPELGGAEFENVLSARVLPFAAQRGTSALLELAGRARLTVPRRELRAGQDVLLGLRAADVLLARGAPTGLSARNILPARVEWLEQRGDDVLCGARLVGDPGSPRIVAGLTPEAAAELELAEGTPLHLVIKSQSCHVLAAL